MMLFTSVIRPMPGRRAFAGRWRPSWLLRYELKSWPAAWPAQPAEGIPGPPQEPDPLRFRAITGPELVRIGDEVFCIDQRHRIRVGDLPQVPLHDQADIAVPGTAQGEGPGVLGPDPFRMDHDPSPAQDGAAKHEAIGVGGLEFVSLAQHLPDVVERVRAAAALGCGRDVGGR